jgi:serine/threonine protein kinase
MNKALKKSTIYDPDTNSVKYVDDTYDGKPFFRKNCGKPNMFLAYSIKMEFTIVKILMEHLHPNIVYYYDINSKYVDMEQVETHNSNPLLTEQPVMTRKELNEIIEVMTKVKDFLQALGIMYIDWKFDNMGKSVDGKYKLFDFDASGLIDLKTQQWKLQANPITWSYRHAIKNGAQTPKEMDDWSFNYNIVEEGKKLVINT